ncbi:MAG: MFS transporter [Chloroflexi bacterium]|nr:MFS transporter [Chloroflexota bacterium]
MDKEKAHRRILNAWALYDWANSAFATVILVALLPVYYHSVAAAGLRPGLATAYWGYTNSAALLAAALLGPLLGALADLRGSKKRYLLTFAVLGATGTGLLVFAGQGQWLLASLFFIVGNVGFSTANVFYDALLAHIAERDELDRVSARGFALGYLGGGLLLAACVAALYLAGPEGGPAVMRLSFLAVALWWAVFSIPLLRHVPEAAATASAAERARPPLRVALARLGGTFNEVRKYRQVLLFLVALWLYTDAIGSITKMAVIVGAEIGIQQSALVGTILAIQFVAAPFSFVFGRLAERYGPKRAILLGLAVYAAVTLGALFMRTSLHFLLLGLAIATAQGGTQAMTRSLGARLVPRQKTGEFFGFVSVLLKFAGILGPALFGIVGQLTGSGQAGFGLVLVYLLLGMVLLAKVNEGEAMRLAQAEEARLAAA